MSAIQAHLLYLLYTILLERQETHIAAGAGLFAATNPTSPNLYKPTLFPRAHLFAETSLPPSLGL